MVATLLEAIACAYCGSTTGPFEDDHVVPRSRGGPDSPRNLVRACKGCNREKKDRLPSEWIDDVPPHVAAIEARVTEHIGNKIRGRRDWKKPNSQAARSATARVPGYDLLKTKMAICLEHDKQMCRAPAEYEVRSPIDGMWSAHCARCAMYYAEYIRRELDEIRGTLHVLAQLRDGTLNRERETVMCAIARNGGVSLDEYIDLACRVIGGDPVVRAHLKGAFPALGLETWEPIGK